VNTDAPWPDLGEAEWRVLKIQDKLHQWATGDRCRRFDDLFNLSPILPSLWWRGIGCGATGGRDRPGLMGWHLALSSSAATCSSPSYEMISRLGGSSRYLCGNG